LQRWVERRGKQDHCRTQSDKRSPSNDAAKVYSPEGRKEELEGRDESTYHSIFMDVSSAAKKRGSPGGGGRSTTSTIKELGTTSTTVGGLPVHSKDMKWVRELKQ